MKLNLDGKRVLITGASRGIGLAIAEAFLTEGAVVFLTSRHQADLDRLQLNLSERFAINLIHWTACDFLDIKQIKRLKNDILTQLDGLDILVLNVGSGKSVSDPIPAKTNFECVFHLNFDTAINTAREFYPVIEKARGNILFITSIAGLEAFGAPVDYAVAKSALVAFSKNLSRKAAADGIRVNCIAPGNIYFKEGDWDQKIKADPGRIRNLIETTVPMRRFGRPEEVAAAALFLTSECASFITGACLTVDGGQTVTVF